MPSALKNCTVYVLILSVETNSTLAIGLVFEGMYSITNCPSELLKGVLDEGRRFSISAFLSLDVISVDGIVVIEPIPSVSSQIGVVVSISTNQKCHCYNHLLQNTVLIL